MVACLHAIQRIFVDAVRKGYEVTVYRVHGEIMQLQSHSSVSFVIIGIEIFTDLNYGAH